MMTFKDNELHYLIGKYQYDAKIGKAMKKLLLADMVVLDGCPNCINQKTLLPNMNALKKWSKRYKIKYKNALDELEKCLLRDRKNADIYALIGYCYFYLDKFSRSIRYYQRAIELAQDNPNFLTAYGGVFTRLSYEVFRKTKQGIKLQDWFGKYLTKRHIKAHNELGEK